MLPYDLNFNTAYCDSMGYPYATFGSPEVDDYLTMLDAGGPLDNKAAV